MRMEMGTCLRCRAWRPVYVAGPYSEWCGLCKRKQEARDSLVEGIKFADLGAFDAEEQTLP